jgi:hypothetical protein
MSQDHRPGGAPVEGVEDLLALDRALDALAAGREPETAAGPELADLVVLAADLRAAVPAPPSGAAAEGRAALLARAGRAGRRSRILLLAAALMTTLLLVGMPALASQAQPGATLWPLRQAGQQVRVALADGPLDRARIRLASAGLLLDRAERTGNDRRAVAMAGEARTQVTDAQDDLGGLAGPAAAAERAVADRLLARADRLLAGKAEGDRRGPGGGGSGKDGDRSGKGGGGSGSSGSGSSGSGHGGSSGASGSGSSESGHGGSGSGGR